MIPKLLKWMDLELCGLCAETQWILYRRSIFTVEDKREILTRECFTTNN